MRCHPSVAHNQILNGASVIASRFHPGRADHLEASTLPQTAAVFDLGNPSVVHPHGFEVARHDRAKGLTALLVADACHGTLCVRS